MAILIPLLTKLLLELAPAVMVGAVALVLMTWCPTRPRRNRRGWRHLFRK